MISFSGVWVKIADVSPVVSAFYRVFIGGIILLVAAAWHRELTWQGFRSLMNGAVCGLIFALDLFFWHRSIQYIGPGLSTILGNFQVFLITAIGVIFLGEKLRLRFASSIPLAMVGLFMIVGVRWDLLSMTYRAGIYYGLATAVAYTLYLITLRKFQSEQTGVSIFYVMTVVSFTTAAFLGMEILRSGDSFAIPSLKSAMSLAALGFFSQAIGWILITNALPRIRASFAGMVLLIQPALAFVWDVLFFNRPTTLINWMGVCLALAGIYLGMTKSSGKR